MDNNNLSINEDSNNESALEIKSIIPVNVLQEVDSLLKRANDLLQAYSHDVALSDRERKRLRGVGVRRRGFIHAVVGLAEERPEMMPQYINMPYMKEILRQVEMLQLIEAALKHTERINGDNILLSADVAYRNSLVFYNNVKEASRTRVPGAEMILKRLRPFFANMRPKATKPTEKEVLRDVKGLLHGTKEGRVVVANENPHVVRGERVVIDNV